MRIAHLGWLGCLDRLLRLQRDGVGLRSVPGGKERNQDLTLRYLGMNLSAQFYSPVPCYVLVLKERKEGQFRCRLED